MLGQSRHTRGAEVVILDVATGKRRPAGFDSSEFGWGPEAGELWFLAHGNDLRAIQLESGRQRSIAAFPGNFQLDDVARNGRLLVEHLDFRGEIRGAAPGEDSERILSWLDSSIAADLSDDGTRVLINESTHGAVYLRKTDGSPAVRLGEGNAFALSPDGAWALAVRPEPSPQLVLLPTGAGDTRVLRTAGFESFQGGNFLPDGNRILFCGTQTGHKPALYVMDLQAETIRPASPEGVELGEFTLRFVSPDGKWVFAHDMTRGTRIYPIDGRNDSAPQPIAGLTKEDMPAGWTPDSHSLYIQGPSEVSPSISLLDWKTGKRTPFRTLGPFDPNGIAMSFVLVTPNGKAWAFSQYRRLSEVYLVEGLK